ncbi:hypothetical protein G7Y41_08370 [Schaalia sp. ZJ405]|uniref:hypothetical protein n=1 Tax=unclassified Schaalia TaxID=2691889 RepID=UPI0013EC6341|nr:MULTISPECIES: hypothetical protein [unclassified Schaalia]QPK81044.1 hypothetical protein G7Y41_08370 [Schaalia sp. ZJ405]
MMNGLKRFFSQLKIEKLAKSFVYFAAVLLFLALFFQEWPIIRRGIGFVFLWFLCWSLASTDPFRDRGKNTKV